MGEGQQQAVGAARTYAVVVGAGLALFGLTGFFYESSFATGDGLVAEQAFGLFYVNGWQNLLHLVAGVIGLALAVRAARLYCAGSALVWLVLAVGGFFGSHGGEEIPTMGGFLLAGTANNLLNLALGGLALAALSASSAAPARARHKTAKPKPIKAERSRKKAKKSSNSKPQVEPEKRAKRSDNDSDGTSIGRPRSASQTKRPRGPIN